MKSRSSRFLKSRNRSRRSRRSARRSLPKVSQRNRKGSKRGRFSGGLNLERIRIPSPKLEDLVHAALLAYANQDMDSFESLRQEAIGFYGVKVVDESLNENWSLPNIVFTAIEGLENNDEKGRTRFLFLKQEAIKRFGEDAFNAELESQIREMFPPQDTDQEMVAAT